MTTNTDHYKKLLLGEKEQLEAELANVGRINPDNPKDWEPTPANLNVMRADSNEAADELEESEVRGAIEVELEKRWANVVAALERIENGTFGYCEKGGESHPIGEDRLEANPAADTCKEHMNS